MIESTQTDLTFIVQREVRTLAQRPPGLEWEVQKKKAGVLCLCFNMPTVEDGVIQYRN